MGSGFRVEGLGFASCELVLSLFLTGRALKV